MVLDLMNAFDESVSLSDDNRFVKNVIIFFCWYEFMNFKHCRVKIEKVSYWLSSKQSMSNHVSLC